MGPLQPPSSTGTDRIVIDHVIYGVRDLDDAIDRFRTEYAIEPLLRSEHPAWGTRNAVLPAGFGQFVELLSVADPEAGTPLVEGLKVLLRKRDRMVGTCLRSPDLDAVARRLSLRVIDGERHQPDRVLRFRRTVPEERPEMPFFIDWHGADAEMDPQYAHGPITGIAWAEYGGDAAELLDWVGDPKTPISTVTGQAGPRRFALRRTGGSEIVIE